MRLSQGFVAVALVLGGCQLKVPVAGVQNPPAYLRIPENEVARGVDAFRASAAKGGMVQVARDIRTCQGTMSPGAPADLVR